MLTSYHIKQLIALSTSLLLAACVSTPVQTAKTHCPDEFSASCYPVWFATNRKPLAATDASKGFGGETDESSHYGRVVIAVPGVRMDKSPDSALWQRLAEGTKPIALNSARTLVDPVAWEKDVRSVFSVLHPKDRDVVVYIHGFGNTFEQAAEQAASLGAALRVPGVMAMFSWPSQGKQGPLNYLRDITALENSEDELAEFLARLGRLAGPGHVHIIAHSLGVNGFLRSMQSAAARAQILAPKMHFGQIILAAPDVNARLFRRLATTVAAMSGRTTLYIAYEDMAVKASEFLHGDHRIGLLATDAQVGAMDTIEVLGRPSNLDVGHSYFRDAPGVLKDIQTLIYFGESPQKRQQRNGAPVPDGPPRKQAWIIHNQN
jgi:esterase/lipase superfamily enzyme